MLPGFDVQVFWWLFFSPQQLGFTVVYSVTKINGSPYFKFSVIVYFLPLSVSYNLLRFKCECYHLENVKIF